MTRPHLTDEASYDHYLACEIADAYDPWYLPPRPPRLLPDPPPRSCDCPNPSLTHPHRFICVEYSHDEMRERLALVLSVPSDGGGG
jgi:hypothetical protein